MEQGEHTKKDTEAKLLRGLKKKKKKERVVMCERIEKTTFLLQLGLSNLPPCLAP